MLRHSSLNPPLILFDVTNCLMVALVLVPTRELCLQVYGIAQQLVHRFHWIVPGYVMGGENRAKEKARLRKGISCPIVSFMEELNASMAPELVKGCHLSPQTL